MTYLNRARNILKDAIKSAIYIDEKARSFYQTEASLLGATEEDLSVQLYNNFKKDGISLDVHKYTIDDEKKKDTLSFFIDNRDLVILDWKLKDQSGEEEALIILAEIIKAEHLHFCTIYTSEDQLDIVLQNILSYFSSVTKEYHDEIKELLEIENYSQDIIEIIHEINLNRFDKGLAKEKIKKLYNIDKHIVARLKEITRIEDSICAITISSISLLNTYKSTSDQPKPSYINSEKKIVVINNTIITILRKEENTAENLLDNYQNHIINDVDSFNQLIGLELHNNLAKTSSIINHEFVSFSKNALLFHRKKLQEENLDHFFNSFMNEVFQEKIALSLRDREYQLLDKSFLDKLYEENYIEPSLEEIEKINLFYNAYKLNKKGKILNFGDVFQIEGEENRYLICITPLCDCLRPQNKIKSNFYFAEGVIMKDKKKALELGDTAFISYLPSNVIVRWGELNNEVDNAKYNPLYIKPYQYKVFENQNVIDENNKIAVHYLNKTGEIKSKTLIYQTTIRSNYAQRIANHAFIYPMRVGIDFVKL
ncbi:response regulator receiver domain [Bacteroides cellulosilyticus]|uniref:response regulator receiver domain n=1 Tax=Bacteroides cellulosilyticus TaxID=246787 RepID=UPI001C375EE4|nr:response regulator receiver domain [Bacteroides cellulosilyticus]MBV3637683.1 hypothetical protein [Bacteroides cellulosilyticus]MBV3663939.1 hypothetical protein [Bacteroides cellulosilyticus]MBV3685926.1 hypothetical protein [Bacteroides cellulosilyticus]MBV3696524.1 hypothetical protein [Bacteroides cellulosilyticus]MBV3708223.1 hypothetical protein [Bacteroides cellulosilyticus]